MLFRSHQSSTETQDQEEQIVLQSTGKSERSNKIQSAKRSITLIEILPKFKIWDMNHQVIYTSIQVLQISIS